MIKVIILLKTAVKKDGYLRASANRFLWHDNSIFASLIGIYYNWCSYLLVA